MKFKPVILIIVVLAACCGLSACATENPSTGEPIPPGDQRFALKEVQSRLPRLRIGMTRTDVLLTLGSPAEETADAWVYRPSRKGFFLPAKALVVKFQDRQYIGYEYQPIVFGARLHTE